MHKISYRDASVPAEGIGRGSRIWAAVANGDA